MKPYQEEKGNLPPHVKIKEEREKSVKGAFFEPSGNNS